MSDIAVEVRELSVDTFGPERRERFQQLLAAPRREGVLEGDRAHDPGPLPAGGTVRLGPAARRDGDPRWHLRVALPLTPAHPLQAVAVRFRNPEIIKIR